MKKKTIIMIVAIIVAVISFTVLCSVWNFSDEWVKCIFSMLFFGAVVTAGCIACTYDGGNDL